MINIVEKNLSELRTIDFIDNSLQYNTNFIYPYHNKEKIIDTTIKIIIFILLNF